MTDARANITGHVCEWAQNIFFTNTNHAHRGDSRRLVLQNRARGMDSSSVWFGDLVRLAPRKCPAEVVRPLEPVPRPNCDRSGFPVGLVAAIHSTGEAHLSEHNVRSGGKKFVYGKRLADIVGMTGGFLPRRTQRAIHRGT